ncbi:lysine N(6)-hydroxylase/L-ornithine N(5)-oxygenase family protein [Acidisphaera sp. S103]|uniref:lysine N(6)-hydroxylase/L-ornithine N(5)-oxygenase family protein n=1 Tax=Acidisphaera sp. S103 TaxID=1747223 RepID=UPI00131BCFB4|nr:SidA/IucD/PvdA family monooxygenase [Acidisphaera sp. S103]
MNEAIEVVGIGVGPANLSLAALLHPFPEVQCRFFERRDGFQWHPGLMLPNAALQVSYLKDLVSLVDPTSRFSFLSFLSAKERLYSFINAGFSQVLRREFNEYLCWVASQLPMLTFGADVEAVSAGNDEFVIETSIGVQRSRQLVIATGPLPSIPRSALPHVGNTVFHASQYLDRNVQIAGRDVVIVGGGQTGAEVLLHILSDAEGLPACVHWLSTRENFLPLDQTPFTNELFTPAYADYFFKLAPDKRHRLLAGQKLASDGISPSLLEALYRRLYELRYLENSPCKWQLCPGRELEEISRSGNGWRITSRHEDSDECESTRANVVVLCTGYAHQLPACLEPIRHRISWESRSFCVNADYSLVWDGPHNSKIYVQNAAKAHRGIADPNLSLIAWRSARIANGIAGRQLYRIDAPESFVVWDAIAAETSSAQKRTALDPIEARW